MKREVWRVILILILLILISFSFNFIKYTGLGIFNLRDVPKDKISLCIENVSINGIYLLSNKGGYIYSYDNVFYTEYEQIAYHLKDGKEVYPERIFMESELSRFIKESLMFCLKDSNIENEISDISTEITINDNYVNVKVDFKRNVKIIFSETTISDYVNLNIPVRLGYVLEKEKTILNNLKNVDLDYLSSQDLIINVMVYDKNNVVYSILDEKSSINEILFAFNFVVKSEDNGFDIGNYNQDYFIDSDFGKIYEPDEGNPVLLLEPQDTGLYLGEDFTEFVEALNYFSTYEEKSIKLLEDIENKKSEDKIGSLASLYLASYYANKQDYETARKHLLKIINSRPFSEEAYNAELLFNKVNSLMFIEASFRANELDYEQWRQRLRLRGFYAGEESAKRIYDSIENQEIKGPFLLYSEILDTLNPAYFVLFMKETFGESCMDLIIYDKIMKEQGLNLISYLIQQGIVNDIPSALNLIRSNGMVYSFEDEKFINVFEKYNFNLDSNGLFCNPRTGEIVFYKEAILSELEDDPVIKAAVDIQYEYNAWDDKGRDKKLLDAAKEYRNDENYQAAATIAKQLSSSLDEDVAKESRDMYNDILDPNDEWFNVADETINFGITDNVINMANPATLYGYGLLSKGGFLILSRTTYGAQLLKIVSSGRGILGQSVSAQIVSQIAWEGVESGLGFMPKVGPGLEMFAMVLDGGPDLDYYARNALKNVNYEISNKIYVTDGEVLPILIVDDLEQVREIKGGQSIDNGYKILDDEGRSFFVVERTFDFSKQGLFDIEAFKIDADKLESISETKARYDEASPLLDSPQFDKKDIATVQTMEDLKSYLRSEGDIVGSDGITVYTPEEIIAQIELVEKKVEGVNILTKSGGIRTKVIAILSGKPSYDFVIKYRGALFYRLIGRMKTVYAGEPIFPSNKPLLNHHPSLQENMVIDTRPGKKFDILYQGILENINKEGINSEIGRLSTVYDFTFRSVEYSKSFSEYLVEMNRDMPKLGSPKLRSFFKNYIDIGETCIYAVGACRHTGFIDGPILGKMKMEGYLNGYGIYNLAGAHAWSEYIKPNGERIIFDVAQNYMGPIRIRSSSDIIRGDPKKIGLDKNGYVLFYAGENYGYFRYSDIKVNLAVNN